jgi:hypothetical protein
MTGRNEPREVRGRGRGGGGHFWMLLCGERRGNGSGVTQEIEQDDESRQMGRWKMTVKRASRRMTKRKTEFDATLASIWMSYS